MILENTNNFTKQLQQNFVNIPRAMKTPLWDGFTF